MGFTNPKTVPTNTWFHFFPGPSFSKQEKVNFGLSSIEGGKTVPAGAREAESHDRRFLLVILSQFKSYRRARSRPRYKQISGQKSIYRERANTERRSLRKVGRGGEKGLARFFLNRRRCVSSVVTVLGVKLGFR